MYRQYSFSSKALVKRKMWDPWNSLLMSLLCLGKGLQSVLQFTFCSHCNTSSWLPPNNWPLRDQTVLCLGMLIRPPNHHGGGDKRWFCMLKLHRPRPQRFCLGSNINMALAYSSGTDCREIFIGYKEKDKYNALMAADSQKEQNANPPPGFSLRKKRRRRV